MNIRKMLLILSLSCLAIEISAADMNNSSAKHSPGNDVAASVNRGEQLWFHGYSCTACHGEEASKEPFPPAVLVEKGFWARSDGVMEFLSNISEQEMADLRAYLKSIGE